MNKTAGFLCNSDTSLQILRRNIKENEVILNLALQIQNNYKWIYISR